MPAQHPLPDLLTITNVETLRVVADATRLRLIDALEKPRTVKELATAFDMPKTRLYYHINLLERHGIVHVVASSVVSGIIEKRYQVTARRFDVDGHIFGKDAKQSHRVDEIAGAIFDNMKYQIRAVAAEYKDDPEKAATLVLNQATIALTPDQLKELHGELLALLARYDLDRHALDKEEDGAAITYNFTYVLVPYIGATFETDGDAQ